MRSSKAAAWVAALALGACLAGCSTGGPVATTLLGAPTTTARRTANVPMIAQQFSAVGPDVAWAWLDANTSTPPYPQRIIRTTDAGTSWQDVTPLGLAVAVGSKYISSADFLSASDAWVTYGGIADGSAQTLLGTTDAGRRWSMMGRLPSPYCEIQFLDVIHGWCVEVGAAMGADQVVVYQTTNGARSWSLVSMSASATGAPGTPGSLPLACDKKLVFVSDTEGWAGFDCYAGRVGSVSPLFETTDAGRSWFDVAIAPLPSGYISVNGVPAAWVVQPVLDGNNGAAGLSVNTGDHVVSLVYHSSDAGSSWQPVPPPGRPRYWGIDLVDAEHWKLVSGHTILSTSNAGQTWQTVHSDRNFSEPGAVPDFVTPEVGWYPGSDSAYRTTDGGTIWARVSLPRAQA